MNDLIGQKFRRLIVDKYIGKNKYGQSLWLCRCNCGNKKIIVGSSLLSGNTKSCGCLKIKHGYAKRGKLSKIYTAWDGMIQRCNNINSYAYKNYGGRGIKVCKRWLKFKNFLKDVGNPPTNKHTLDRINNNKGYNPNNWRWSTPKEQSRNKRSSNMITYKNKTQCLTSWAEEYKINPNTLKQRLSNNWSIERALLTPVKKHIRRSN